MDWEFLLFGGNRFGFLNLNLQLFSYLHFLLLLSQLCNTDDTTMSGFAFTFVNASGKSSTSTLPSGTSGGGNKKGKAKVNATTTKKTEFGESKRTRV
jgi:hypothetical protein